MPNDLLLEAFFWGDIDNAVNLVDISEPDHLIDALSFISKVPHITDGFIDIIAIYLEGINRRMNWSSVKLSLESLIITSKSTRFSDFIRLWLRIKQDIAIISP
jgi:hypothetical protein